MADKRRLAELGMATELAKEVAAQIDATPTATTRGGVLQQTATANIGGAPSQSDFNSLLAKLRSAGVLAT